MSIINYIFKNYLIYPLSFIIPKTNKQSNKIGSLENDIGKSKYNKLINCGGKL